MTTAKEGPSVEKLTAMFIKMRDKKAALAAAYKAEEDEINAAMDVVRAELLDYCKEQNVDSVRTKAGLFFRTVKTRYWARDWDAMRAFVKENDALDFFEKRLSQGAVKAFLEENPDVVPPGLVTDSEYAITVRKA